MNEGDDKTNFCKSFKFIKNNFECTFKQKNSLTFLIQSPK